MNKVKFRAFITDAKEMVYTHTVQDKYNFVFYFSEGLVIEQADSRVPKGRCYTHSDIMQYTGLKDKNGKEIYQNDLIKYPNKTIQGYDIYQVDSILNFGYFILYKDIIDKLEIVGNIYENPELLA